MAVHMPQQLFAKMDCCLGWREAHLSSEFLKKAFLFLYLKGKPFIKQVLKFQIGECLLLNVHTVLYTGFIQVLYSGELGLMTELILRQLY